jgi:hypothetical protein
MWRARRSLKDNAKHCHSVLDTESRAQPRIVAKFTSVDFAAMVSTAPRLQADNVSTLDSVSSTNAVQLRISVACGLGFFFG